MNKLITTCVLCTLLITGCSSKESSPVSVKEPEQDADQHNPEQSDDLPDMISIPLEGEILEVHLPSIPLLDMYLHTSESYQQELNHIKAIPVSENLYLVSYACDDSETLCSHILIYKESDGTMSLPVADFSTFHEAVFSPSGQKVLLQFVRPVNGKEVSHLVVIDLNSFEQLSLQNEALKRDVLHYQTSILEKEWVHDTQLKIKIPYDEFPPDDKGAQWIEFEL